MEKLDKKNCLFAFANIKIKKAKKPIEIDRFTN